MYLAIFHTDKIPESFVTCRVYYIGSNPIFLVMIYFFLLIFENVDEI